MLGLLFQLAVLGYEVLSEDDYYEYDEFYDDDPDGPYRSKQWHNIHTEEDGYGPDPYCY